MESQPTNEQNCCSNCGIELEISVTEKITKDLGSNAIKGQTTKTRKQIIKQVRKAALEEAREADMPEDIAKWLADADVWDRQRKFESADNLSAQIIEYNAAHSKEQTQTLDLELDDGFEVWHNVQRMGAPLPPLPKNLAPDKKDKRKN